MNLTGKPPMGQKTPKAKPDPDYLDRVRGLSCCICEALGITQQHPTAAHHWIIGRASQRKTPDCEAIPLCWLHHQGPDGIHTRRAWWEEQFGLDKDYIWRTQETLFE